MTTQPEMTRAVVEVHYTFVVEVFGPVNVRTVANAVEEYAHSVSEPFSDPDGWQEIAG